MKYISLYLFLATFYVNAGDLDDNKSYAKDKNQDAVSSVNNGDPWTVPNYQEPHPDYKYLMDNSDQLKQEGAAATTNSEAAQVIYGLGKRDTSFKEESWYKEAQNAEKNPDNVLNLNGSESNCTTTTIPGEKYVENASCIDAETSVEKSCSEGVIVEVNASYDYQCNKTRENEGQSCSVGRIINVTKNNIYNCVNKQIFSEETCEQWWEIKSTGTTVCDYGWDRSGQLCIQPSKPSCQPGYSLSLDNKCVQTVYTAASKTCPSGTSVTTSDGQCRQPTIRLPFGSGHGCPDGFINDSGGRFCSKYGAIVQPTYMCSNGDVLSGTQCVRTITVPANKTCPAGSTLNGDTCSKEPTGSPPTAELHDNCAEKGITY